MTPHTCRDGDRACGPCRSFADSLTRSLAAALAAKAAALPGTTASWSDRLRLAAAS